MGEFESVGNAVAKISEGKRARIALVRALFRPALTEKMEAVARKRAGALGATVAGVLLARGTLEFPLLAKKLLQDKGVDAVVVLGVVVKGKTGHDRIVVEQSTRALVQLSLEYGKPVGIGIIGPGVTLEQAEERAGEYAQGAVDAAVCSCAMLER